MSRYMDEIMEADQAPDEGPTDAELAGEMEIAARITNAETPEPWAIYDVRANRTGVYYVINVKGKGGLIVPVTVKHSTRFDTFVCFTCNTHNTCKHAKFVRRYAGSHRESKAS